MSEPKIVLAGDKLGLGLTRADMLPEYHRWETDPGSVLGYGAQLPPTLEARRARWERNTQDRTHSAFEVVRLEDNTPVGMSVLNVNFRKQTAEFVLGIAPEARGNRYAVEATRLTLDWGFNLAGLRAIWLKVLEPNVSAVKAYERAGFSYQGRQRRAGTWMGREVDELLMDILREEFHSPSWAASRPGLEL
ncbi:GNAT family N-acetyltransferase [Streptomyces kaniharaensis]|uniref:GNAT family N-acetyltransferase n=1 Tax=Streptomyces kaniharaensis TaxID=212423 RepID=A0A6N7KHH8_9ACTN|nr:GNAT family protein [Streptomyces kaniharaensis]MQS10932.1 GNAT family N-acetyltransferase [Streptomyces kaniharaensis]